MHIRLHKQITIVVLLGYYYYQESRFESIVVPGSQNYDFDIYFLLITYIQFRDNF